MAAVPAWLRRALPDAQSLAGRDVEDVALTAGAAIGALDAVVRRQQRWAGAWRQRLAAAAGAYGGRGNGKSRPAVSRMKARCATPCCSPGRAIFCTSVPPDRCCWLGAGWPARLPRNC
ncbi:DUF1403 family protein [Mesorhizobium sp. M1334]